MPARASQVALEVLGVPTPSARLAAVAVEVLSAVPIPSARTSQVALEVLSVRPATTTTLDAKGIIFVAEMTAAVDDAGTLETFYATDSIGWVTGAADTPADTHVQPTLSDPGTYRRELFSGARPYGAVRPSFGVAALRNLDGRYDDWKFHGFDGRAYTVYAGRHGAAFPSAFELVFKATIDKLDVGFREVQITLRDDLGLLDKSVLVDTFAGTGGVEGLSDLAGKPKPRIFGDPLYHPVTEIPLVPPVVSYRPKPQTFTASATVETPVDQMYALQAPLPYNVSFEIDLSPSSATALLAGTTTDTTLTIYRYNPQAGALQTLGTLTFAVGATTGVWSVASAWILEAGEAVLVKVNGAPDATLSGIAITIAGLATTNPASPFSPDPA